MGPRNALLDEGKTTGVFGGVSYGATKQCVLGVQDAFGRGHRSLRWSSLLSHETLCWVWKTHAAAATGVLGGVS
eukprot:2606660-Pyramimonas_sp.AAC.1